MTPVRRRSSSANRDRISTGDGQVFALVKWLNGTCANTHSIVESEWILDFDPTSAFDPTGYAVEWRQPPKPRAGWNIYNAIVIDVSDNKDVLKDLKDRQEQEESNRVRPVVTPAPASNTSAPSDALLNLLQQLMIGQRQNAAVTQPNGTIPTTPTTPSHDEDHVKVGKSLSVPKSIYLEAKSSKSPSAMTMILVRSSFSRRRLIRSSYAGQKRTRNGKVERKPGLKKYQRMRDIQDFVRSRYPTVVQSIFGAAVNSCTGAKAEKRQEIEYMELELSEEEEMDH